jgi:hypothetical protein
MDFGMDFEAARKKAEEVREKAEAISRLAIEIYDAMKDIQKFVAEQRSIDEEPDWNLIDVLIARTCSNAARIKSDMRDVVEAAQRIERARRGVREDGGKG